MDSFYQAPVGGTGQSFYSDQIISAQDRKDPKKVGALFEGMFYRILFKQVRESGLSEDIFDSSQMQQVRGMMDDEMSNHLGFLGHLGIADLIEDQLKQEKSNLQGLLK